MTSTPFAELSSRRQLHRLRAAARQALDDYALAGARLDLVVHDFNATYRVTTSDGERFALRINLNSQHPVDGVLAEAEWVARLADDPELLVPAPARTVDGRLATIVDVEDLDRQVPAVVYRWLDGPNLGSRVRPRHAFEIGRTAARLHAHGASLPRSVTGHRLCFDHYLMDSPDRLGTLDVDWLDDDLRDTLHRARTRLEPLVEPVLSTPPGMIHGDLHPWNVKWYRGRLAVFDFDDCGLASPMFELAISSYYLRAHPGADQALRDGYRSIAPLDWVDAAAFDEVFEALVASRSLLLLNDLVGTETASHRDLVPSFAARTGRRLRHWLDSGRFDTVLP
ncbi:MAG: phosphotransferase [Actinomycetota bacterium]